MNIKNDFCAKQIRYNGTEHQKIWHIMIMNKPISLLKKLIDNWIRQ